MAAIDPINVHAFGQFISALGIIGNSFLLWIILYSKKLKDPSYVFVTTIATSDLISSIQVLVIFTTSKTFFFDEFGHIICKIAYTIFYTSYSASTLSLTLISIYRFNIVSEPHRFKQTSYIYKNCFKLTILIWMVSILFAVPLHPVIRYINMTRSCDIYYPYGNTYTTIYFSSSLLIYFVIPGFIMIICYIRIASKLNSRIHSVSIHITAKPRALIRSKELFKFYSIVAAIYMMLSWPFLMILIILSIFQKTQVSLLDTDIGFAWAFSVGFFATNILYVVNPIMFMAFDKNIRSDIRKLPNWIISRCTGL